MKTASYITSLSLTALAVFLLQFPSQSAPPLKSQKISLDSQLKDAMSWIYRDTNKPTALLKSGANPNAYNGQLFNLALAQGNEALVRSFIRHGARITPSSLEFAIGSNQSRRMTEILLNRGANPNAAIQYKPQDERKGETILLTPVMMALELEQSETAILLVQRGANIHARLKNGETALRFAAISRNISFCKFLLDKKADFTGSQEALLNAVIEKNDLAFFDRLEKLKALPRPLVWPPIFMDISLPMAKKLVAAGATPNLSPRFREYSPLRAAISRKDVPLAQFLVQHGAIVDGEALRASIPDYYKSPARIEREAAELQAAYSENPDPFADDESETHVSRKEVIAPDDLRLLKLFLENGANPNQKTYWFEQTTPLHVAASRNRVSAIALLLKHGAKIEAKDREGETPLFYAIKSGSEEAVKFLLDNGADLEAQDFEGQTPLMKSLEEGAIIIYAPIATYTPPQIDTLLFDYLIERGAHINATTKNGVSVLHVASVYGNLSAVKTLLKRGAFLEAKTHKAVSLLDKNDIGATPLLFAVSMAQIEVAKILFVAGANPDSATQQGLTPRKLATQPYVTQFKTDVAGEKNMSPEMKAYNQKQLASMKQGFKKLDQELTKRRLQILKLMEKR